MNWDKINWDKIGKIGMLLGVVIPLWGGLGFLYKYEKNLVKQHERNEDKIDYTISVTELKVLSYELYGIDKLTDLEKGRYERAKARLINLEAQRDKELGGTND